MAKRFERRDKFRVKFSAPVEERIRYYYILNFGATEIANCLRNEFRELELTEFSRKNVEVYITRNMEALSKDKEDYRLKLRDQIDGELKENFTAAHLYETRIVRVYIKKGEEALSALEELDLLAKDEDGNFVNRGQFITLMMIIKENQQMVERLAQTAAAREYTLFAKKAAIKAQTAKDGGLDLPEDAEVTFLEDSADPSGFLGVPKDMKSAHPKKK
jgi:hypothetical protein